LSALPGDEKHIDWICLGVINAPATGCLARSSATVRL